MGFLSTTDEWQEAVEGWQGIGDRPAPRSRSRSKGFRVLESGLLEHYFATAQWYLPGLWVLPFAAWLEWATVQEGILSSSSIMIWTFVGVLGWTFNEYWLHRWLFHLPPSRNRMLVNIQFMLHGYHHEHPNDPGRLVAPLILSWPIAIVLAVAYWALLGALWKPLFAGTTLGYLAYDWIHYYTHHGRPMGRLGRYLRRLHISHHYRDATTNFGLSSPLWDYVFQTVRDDPRAQPLQEE